MRDDGPGVGRKDIIQEIHALAQRGYELHFRALGSALHVELTHSDDGVASVVKLFNHSDIVSAHDMVERANHAIAVMAAGIGELKKDG